MVGAGSTEEREDDIFVYLGENRETCRDTATGKSKMAKIVVKKMPL